MRREELGMEARLTLFATLSERLQDDAGFFKPAHLSDEKLVLLVAAALAARNAERARAPGRPASSEVGRDRGAASAEVEAQRLVQGEEQIEVRPPPDADGVGHEVVEASHRARGRP